MNIRDAILVCIFWILYKKHVYKANVDWIALYASVRELFDDQWYISHYKLKSNKFAFLHFLFIGLKRNYVPSTLFDSKFFEEQKNKYNYLPYANYGLIDFLVRPNAEYISPNKYFNGIRYLNLYSDVMLTGMNPFIHYIRHGKKEGRISEPYNLELLEVESSILIENEFSDKSSLRSCLLIFAEDFSSLSPFLKDTACNSFESIYVIIKNSIDALEDLAKNVKIVSLAQKNVEENPLLILDLVRDYDCFLKLNLTDYFQFTATTKVNSYNVKEAVEEIIFKTLLKSKHFIEKTFEENKHIGAIGSLSFLFKAKDFLSKDKLLYRSFYKENSEELNWSFFGNGSYWLRTDILKSLLVTNRSSFFKSKKNYYSDEVFNFTLELDKLDFLLGLEIFQNKLELGYIQSSGKSWDSKKTLIKISAQKAVEKCIKYPFRAILLESKIDDYIATLTQSKLFDNDSYNNHDSTIADREDSIIHYLRYGAFQGKNPSNDFHNDAYLYSYPTELQLNPLAHYLTKGKTNSLKKFPTETKEFIKIIQENESFEKDYYTQHIELSSQNIQNPLAHYLNTGWKCNLEPNKNFSSFLYLSQFDYHDFKTINPLVHKLIYESGKTLYKRPDQNIVEQSGIHKKICLFAGYDNRGVIDDYVVVYLKELSKYADVFYLADCEIEEHELDKIRPFTLNCWAIRHQEYDFGSYKRLIENLVGWDKIEKYDELILANDSTFLIKPLEQVFRRMNQEKCDWWGLQTTSGIYDTRNLPRNKFRDKIPISEFLRKNLKNIESAPNFDFLVGSYFLAFRKKVILSDHFKNFIRSITKEYNKKSIILKYEIGLTKLLLKKGYELSTFIKYVYPFHPIYSKYHFSLLEEGFPLFKRLLLTNNHYKIKGLNNWENEIAKYSSSKVVEQIESNILGTANYEDHYQSIYGEFERFSDDRFAELDKTTSKDEKVWIFPVCGYQHTLSGNLRAIFEQVKDDETIKKVILLRSKHVFAEGNNVIKVPLKSKIGISYLLTAKVIFLKHTIPSNIGFKIDTQSRYIFNLWHGIPLKKIGISSLDQKNNITRLVAQNQTYSSIIASSETDSKNMLDAFQPIAKEKVWITGLPRLDFVLCKEDKLPSDMKLELGRLKRLKGDKKLVVYMPTFRNAQKTYSLTIEDKINLFSTLNKYNALIGVREHLATTNRGFYEQLQHYGSADLSANKIIHVEMIYRVADVLITDYSSCFIDFMVLNKPMLSFAFDLEHYANEERGFYYTLNEVFPGAISSSFPELLKHLKEVLSKKENSIDYERYKNAKSILFKHLDDNNTERLLLKIQHTMNDN